MIVLHSAILLYPYIGILKQMEMEQLAAVRDNLNWRTVLFVPKDSGIKSNIIRESNYVSVRKLDKVWYRLYAWLALKIEYYIFLLRESDVDFVIHRYSMYDIFQLLYLCLETKKVFLIHHTMEESELLLNSSMIGRIKFLMEKMIGKLSLYKSFGIIAVTDELRRYELSRIKNINKPSFVLPNGIIVDRNLIKSEGNGRKNGYYKLLFVASDFVLWHGLDLLFKDMESNDRQDCELHLIGSIYPDELKFANKDKRVILHGLQDSEYIKKISVDCDIALASFALFRKNVTEACTLKVREYLSLGLPVYSGHKDVFDENFKFYKVGKPSLDEIVEYAKLMRTVNPIEVQEASIEYLDKGIIMNNCINFLREFYI